MKKSVLIMIFSLILALVSGCGDSGGGSSSSSSTSALKVADRVSVVDAQTSGTSSSANVRSLDTGLRGFRAASDLPASSDYNTDETVVFVEERSADAFEIINEILCMMGQSGYRQMLNKGDYKALIDLDQCAQNRDSASSAGQSSQNQSSGSNATEYETWTVNSSRADNNSPHIVKVWIHEKAEDMGGGFAEPAKAIDVKTTITESASATNPYGIFVMNFKAHPEGSSTEMFSGYLRAERDSSGTVLLKFYMDGGMDFDSDGQNDVSFTEKVTLDRASDGSSGAGSIAISETNPFDGNTSKTFNIAYNDSYFLRSDGTTDVCMSRANPDVTAWRYGLYYDENHSTPGGRVTLNSGFPIRYNDGSQDYHGWVGFHGLWFPESVSLSSGDTVYKQDYSSSGTSETAYTVFISGGKLRRHTKKSLTLGDIASIPLMWNSCTDQGGGNWTCKQYRVEWDSTAQKLYKNAELDETNWVWKNISPAQEVTFSTDAWDFDFWSESLGGAGRINLKDPTDPTGQAQITLANTTPIVFHIEDTVFPGDSNIPTSLACFENCPDPSTINTASPYINGTSWQDQNNLQYQDVAPASATRINYTFDSTNMVLVYNSSSVVMTDNSNNQWGVWSGALFEPTSENLSQLACDWDQSGDSTCAWQAWDNLSVFYTWETGTQSWNKLTALQKDGSFVSFDPPISVEYTHTWDDSSTSKLYLEYGGFGDLWGIPGKCVDMDTGQDTDCYDASGTKFIRWVPEFSITDGSSVTDATSGLTYYVKALEKEERMSAVSTSQCTGAGLSLQSYTLPDASLYADPNIGTEPTVDGAPAVIGGVLQ